MKTILLTLLLSGIAEIFPTNTALTCTCDELPTIAEGYKESDIVISGKIISEEPFNEADLLEVSELESEEDNSGADEIEFKRFRVEVLYNYKGTIHSPIILIKTPAEDSACGYKFNVGREYIIYGWVADNNQADRRLIKNNVSDLIFATHLCTRTREWNPEEHRELILLEKKS